MTPNLELSDLSEAKLAANRANAQKSTGPRTPEGKAASSKNSRLHGLFISDTALIQEEPEEFAQILAGYITEFCPVGALEERLVNQLTLASMRQDRFARIESGLLWDDDAGCTRHEATMNMTKTFEEKAKQMELLYRVQAQAERSFYEAYNALEDRKRKRVFARIPPEEIQIEANLRHEPRKLRNEPTPRVPPHNGNIFSELRNEPKQTSPQTDDRQPKMDHRHPEMTNGQPKTDN
jgi:hypothetical protein